MQPAAVYDASVLYPSLIRNLLMHPATARHSHATELVNGGGSLATIRKRLGHQHLQTTLRYAEVSDTTADAELRHWRRKRPHHAPRP